MVDIHSNELDRIILDVNKAKDENNQKINELRLMIETLREKNLELEKENKNMQVKKTDMKNKVNILEKQIEDNKKSMNDIQKTFENILTNTLSKTESEKDALEKEYKEKIAFLELQFFGKVKKLEEDNQNKIFEIVRENKELEEELNNLSKQAFSSLKMNDPINLSNKIHDLLKIQDNLRRELELTKLEKDTQIAELISKFEREKEHYNIKILEYEIKIKTFDPKNISNNDLHRSIELFEAEKDKLKWKHEKEKLLATIENLNTQIAKIEKKSEYISKDRENLKASFYLSSNNLISDAQNLFTNVNKNYFNLNSNKDDRLLNNGNEEENDNIKGIFYLKDNNFLNDKEILIENIKKSSLNLNLNAINSPPIINTSKNNSDNNNNVNNENKIIKNYKLISNSPTNDHPKNDQNKFNSKESNINKFAINVNNNSKISPFKMKK